MKSGGSLKPGSPDEREFERLLAPCQGLTSFFARSTSFIVSCLSASLASGESPLSESMSFVTAWMMAETA